MDAKAIAIVYLLSQFPSVCILVSNLIFGVRPLFQNLKSSELHFTIFVWGFGRIRQDTDTGCRITLIVPLCVMICEFEYFDCIK